MRGGWGWKEICSGRKWSLDTLIQIKEFWFQCLLEPFVGKGRDPSLNPMLNLTGLIESLDWMQVEGAESTLLKQSCNQEGFVSGRGPYTPQCLPSWICSSSPDSLKLFQTISWTQFPFLAAGLICHSALTASPLWHDIWRVKQQQRFPNYICARPESKVRRPMCQRGGRVNSVGAVLLMVKIPSDDRPSWTLATVVKVKREMSCSSAGVGKQPRLCPAVVTPADGSINSAGGLFPRSERANVSMLTIQLLTIRLAALSTDRDACETHQPGPFRSKKKIKTSKGSPRCFYWFGLVAFPGAFKII